MDALLGSVRVALALASLVTMIAAFFIIYETIAISVEQRRREIAIARALGFTRGAVAGVFMLESLILGCSVPRWGLRRVPLAVMAPALVACISW
jgi:ABC-type antimicrobial peptide transport system permease subunit